MIKSFLLKETEELDDKKKKRKKERQNSLSERTWKDFRRKKNPRFDILQHVESFNKSNENYLYIS